MNRIIALALAAMLAFSMLGFMAAANAEAPVHKSYVCKYVGKPGDFTERVQTGQNPIWVDNHALSGADAEVAVGDDFADGQTHSYVIVANTPRLDPEPTVDDCPKPAVTTDEGTDVTTENRTVVDCESRTVKTESRTKTVSWTQVEGQDKVYSEPVYSEWSTVSTRPATGNECPKDKPTDRPTPTDNSTPTDSTPRSNPGPDKPVEPQVPVPTAVDAGLVSAENTDEAGDWLDFLAGLVAGGLITGGAILVSRSRGSHEN